MYSIIKKEKQKKMLIKIIQKNENNKKNKVIY